MRRVCSPPPAAASRTHDSGRSGDSPASSTPWKTNALEDERMRRWPAGRVLDTYMLLQMH